MTNIREGDLCKIVEIEGHIFEIRYGYYDPELERERNDPMPIYPNFLKEPQYTAAGYPFVTADQEICQHFHPKSNISGEGWCNDCRHLEKHEEFLGICRCPKRQKTDKENEPPNGGTAI